MPQTSGFRAAKQILVVSFATQARAFILSDRSIFYTPGGRTTAWSNAPGAFLVHELTGLKKAAEIEPTLGHVHIITTQHALIYSVNYLRKKIF